MPDCCDAPMLTAGELADMAATAAQTLTASCTITRPTLTVDNLGGQTTVWATVATSVPCRVGSDRASATEQVEAERDTYRLRATLEVPVGTDIRPIDRVTVDGRTFEITAVSVGTFDVTRRCQIVEVS